MIIKKKNDSINNTPSSEAKPQKPKLEDEKVDLFDLDNIDFSQRQERRRGDRRRGYRRIDDRNLISRAQEEAGQIRESAANEGYKVGIENAKEDIQKFKSGFVEFLKAKTEVFEYIAPDILEISVDIARKIVKKEIEQDPQLILETITDVLQTLSKDESRVSIKVNPSQYSIAKDALPSIVASLGIEVKTKVVADDTIEEGGCILQTTNGIVDATIESQLEIIKEVFKGM